MGTIELFRGFRGDVSSYGVSTIDDSLGPEGKAVLISAATALVSQMMIINHEHKPDPRKPYKITQQIIPT